MQKIWISGFFFAYRLRWQFEVWLLPFKVSTCETKEHNNRQNVNICIRNLDSNKEGKKANERFWKESV
jgi:hypothetical protein